MCSVGITEVLFVYTECVLSSAPHSLSAEEDEGVQTEWGFISDDIHRTHSAVHANPMSLQPLPHHGTGTERTASGFCHRMHYVLCMDLPLSHMHTCTNTRAHIRTLTHAHMHKHTCTHTHTHTCTWMHARTPSSAISTRGVAMGQPLVGDLLLIMVDTFILSNFDPGFAVYDVLTGDIVRKLHHNPQRVSNHPDRETHYRVRGQCLL